MSNETERTLHELKLPGMASCWSSLEETHQLDKLTLREGMQIMLQYERDTRGNNRIQRLIKNAGFLLEEKKPISDVATSHLARRTFIGNLYRMVKDPDLVASMSGHAKGSVAFARYRVIDDDMKKSLVELIQ